MSIVKTTERGWAGHFICANRCRFRRNTLIEHELTKIVVSTVGLMEDIHSKVGGFDFIGGFDRYYETMAFHADPEDTRYHDIDVERDVSFESEWAICEIDADDKANVMHDNIVSEISKKLKKGTL